jgi:hypothetical protein
MKTTIPVDDIAGTAQQCKQLLTRYKADMVAKGVDPSTLLDKLEADCAAMVTTDQTQEQTKTALREQTTTLQASKGQTYATLACGIDMVIAAFGRTSERGKEATRLRRQLTKSRRRNHVTPLPKAA